MSKVIIIPDVHGRTFWRSALSWVETTPIVFLGDYLDPYRDEGIDSEEAYEQLDEIFDFKKRYPESITLLLGNHDVHYLSDSGGGCRYDWRHAYENKALLWSNLELFDIADAIEVGKHQYLFTHAGVLRGWYEDHYGVTGQESAKGIASLLNEQFHDEATQTTIMRALSEMTPRRGGTHLYGSPVWADVTEQSKQDFEFEGIYQVFGHTLMFNEIITPHWACIDCRRSFVLDINTGDINELLNY